MCVPALPTTIQGVSVSRAPFVLRDPPPPPPVPQGCTVMTTSWPHLKVCNSTFEYCVEIQYLTRIFYKHIWSLQLGYNDLFLEINTFTHFMRDNKIKNFMTACMKVLYKLFSLFLGNCQAGYYCPTGQTEANPAPFLCIAGHYCEEGSGTPTQCPIGTFSNATGNSNVTNCKPCTAGEKAFILENDCIFKKYIITVLTNLMMKCKSLMTVFVENWPMK